MDTLIEYNKNDYEINYRNIIDYEGLIKANISYLKGEIPCTPYVFDKIDDETIPILDDLISLNRRGILTICSQPSIAQYDKILADGFFHSIEQKPFIEGYIHKKYTDELSGYLQGIDLGDEKIFYYFAYFEDSGEKKYHGDLGAGCINVTRYKIYEHINKRDQTEWIPYTHIREKSCRGFEEFIKFANIQNFLTRDYAYFIITIDKYGTTVDLFKMLYVFLKKMNILLTCNHF